MISNTNLLCLMPCPVRPRSSYFQFQVFYEHHLRLKWEHLFLFLATYCLFSCWRHIHKQYLVMAFPRPEQVVVDVESVVRDYLRPATAHSPPGDLPPKYEEVQAASSQVGKCWGS